MASFDVSVDSLDLAHLLEHSVAIAPGVMLPERFTVRATARQPGVGLRVVIDAVSDIMGARASSVTCIDTSGRGLKSEAIRLVPVTGLVASGARMVVWIRDDEGGMVIGFSGGDLMAPYIVDQWPDGPRVDVFLRHAAAIYRVAEALGEAPTAAVVEATGFSRATAGRIVNAARSAGLLRPALKRPVERVEDLASGVVVKISPPEGYLQQVEWDLGKGQLPITIPPAVSRDELEAAEGQFVQDEIDRRRGK